MAEQTPHLRPEVIDLAWETAQASNRALDALREAEAVQEEIARLAPGAGVNIHIAATEALKQKRTYAKANFDLLTNMAAPIMRLPGDPFATESTEIAPIVLPEVDAETAKRLEVLPADYRERVVTRHAEARETIARLIKDGMLPETYQLPELSTFAERIIALAPTYEAFAVRGWQPEVVFVPEGLSFEQWHGLLSGYKLKSGYHNKSKGAQRSWGDYANSLTDPTAKETADNGVWGIAIVSATDDPVLLRVSPDGTYGPNAKEAVKALAELPTVSNASNPEAVIKQFSPSQDVYFGLQLARFERSEQPVDAESWTIGKENIMVDGAVQSLRFSYGQYVYQICSHLADQVRFHRHTGVRPSVRGKDLIPGS